MSDAVSKKVVVVGGGIGGLATAYFLAKSGADVTVIDRGTLDQSSSIGNAGFLSMFEKSPFAYPGVFRDTARAFWKKRTPMVINSPFDPALLRWGYGFFKASKVAKYKKTLAILEHFGEEVFSFYQTLKDQDGVDCEYARGGFALIYTDPETYRKKLNSIPHGSPFIDVLSKAQIAENFPWVLEHKVAGAVLLKRNGHLNPGKVISGLKTLLESRGVTFVLNTEVRGFETRDSRITSVKTDSEQYPSDDVVIATGAELKLPQQLRTKLVMTAGRGYSLTFPMDAALKPKLPALFSDIYTAVSPRRDDVRITGKIEFGQSRSTPQEMTKSMVSVLSNYTKPFSVEGASVWAGDRPLTSDDMPYLGRDAVYNNAVYITGLGHTGMNIGPVGARIISDLIANNRRNVESAELLLLSAFYQN